MKCIRVLAVIVIILALTCIVVFFVQSRLKRRCEVPPQSKTHLRVMFAPWMFGKYPVRRTKERFERRHPGVTVELIKTPDAYESRLLISLMSGQSNFDLIFCPKESLLAVWVARDLALPWDDYIRDRPHMQRDAFLHNFYDSGNHGGLQYGLPVSAGITTFCVNKEMAEKAGLLKTDGTIRFAETWEDVFDYAHRMTIDEDGDGRAEVVGMAVNWYFGHLALYGTIKAAEGKISKGNPIKLPLESPAVRKMLSLCKTAADEGILTLASMTDSEQPRNDLKAGLVAMILTHHTRFIEAEQTLGYGNVTIMPIPGPYRSSVGESRMVVIPRNSRAIELARLFTEEELLAPYFCSYATERFGGLPCHRKLFDTLNRQEFRWLADWAARSEPPPMVRDTLLLQDTIKRNQQNYLAGYIDLDTMLDRLKKELAMIDMRDVRGNFVKGLPR